MWFSNDSSQANQHAGHIVARINSHHPEGGLRLMVTNLKRLLKWSSVAIAAFAATMTVKAPEATAVVYCKAGVYRAGCVVRRPVARPYGVARRTARRTTRRVYRRSDIELKQDIVLLGRLDNGLGFYRFHYK